MLKALAFLALLSALGLSAKDRSERNSLYDLAAANEWPEITPVPAFRRGPANLPTPTGQRLALEKIKAAMPESRLNDVLYASALRVSFPWTEYAVLYYEDERLIILLRREKKGRYPKTYGPLSELNAINWIMAADGVMYGMRLEKKELVFYSQPVQQLP